jgi:protein-disulfide isomerase
MGKRKTRVSPKSSNQKSTISPIMIVGVGVAAVLLVVGLIVLGNQSNQTSIAPVDTSQFPTVGEATAPVTIVEYSDYG